MTSFRRSAALLLLNCMTQDRRLHGNIEHAGSGHSGRAAHPFARFKKSALTTRLEFA
jgi:hypothetical protein